MCLIALNWQPDQATPLLVVANRDEFFARPTRALHHWPGQAILAGQDLQAGGTWLGLGGGAGLPPIRMAALTNHRDVDAHKPDAVSRGHLTAAFLNSAVRARNYLEQLSETAHLYNPFNLILFDGRDLMGFESRHARLFDLPTGITAVSNADFNTPWPKLQRLRTAFEQTLAAHADNALPRDTLFELLADDRLAPDAALPQTGITRDRERVLSATFVRSPDYGTRASSVVRIGQHAAEFTERRFDASGFKGEVTHTLSWRAPCPG